MTSAPRVPNFQLGSVGHSCGCEYSDPKNIEVNLGPSRMPSNTRLKSAEGAQIVAGRSLGSPASAASAMASRVRWSRA